MTSELWSLERLDRECEAAAAVRPDPEMLKTYVARVEEGSKKIKQGVLNGADADRLKAAREKLDTLSAELEEMSRREQRWFVLSSAMVMLASFRMLACVPGNARMAIVLPGLIEVKVRLDGTDDVPF